MIAERTGARATTSRSSSAPGGARPADLIGETLATIDNADVPGFAKAAVEGHSGTHALRRDRRHRPARPRLRHPHPLLRGPRRARGGARRAHRGRRRLPRPSCSPTAAAASTRTWAPGTPGADPRPHQPDGATPRIEGANFVDLTDLYSPRLRDLAREVDPDLDEGVYVQFRGPHYETPAEVQMAKIDRRRPGRHVDDARGHRRPPVRPGGARHLAGDQPRRRHQRPAAVARRGARGRPRRRRALRPPAGRRRRARLA